MFSNIALLALPILNDLRAIKRGRKSRSSTRMWGTLCSERHSGVDGMETLGPPPLSLIWGGGFIFD